MEQDQIDRVREIADEREAMAAMVAEYPESVQALEADALILRALLEERGDCAWTVDDDGAWSTACGRVWQFEVGGPAENRMTYCMGCGRRVVAPAESGGVPGAVEKVGE